jgi:hypothetical protein
LNSQTAEEFATEPFGSIRKAADPALAVEFMDDCWTAILSGYTDHTARTAEDGKILGATQRDWRFENDSCMRESVLLAGFGEGANSCVGFRVSQFRFPSEHHVPPVLKTHCHDRMLAIPVESCELDHMCIASRQRQHHCPGS